MTQQTQYTITARPEFTSSEKGVLRSRYSGVVSQHTKDIATWFARAAVLDHERAMAGESAVLLHGAEIVAAEHVEDTSACPRCIAEAAITGLDAEIERWQREDAELRGGRIDHDAALTHYRGLQGRLEDEEAEAEAGKLDAKLERMRESDGIARRLRSLRYRATRSTPAESRSLYEEIERLEARRDALDGALAEGGR